MSGKNLLFWRSLLRVIASSSVRQQRKTSEVLASIVANVVPQLVVPITAVFVNVSLHLIIL